MRFRVTSCCYGEVDYHGSGVPHFSRASATSLAFVVAMFRLAMSWLAAAPERPAETLSLQASPSSAFVLAGPDPSGTCNGIGAFSGGSLETQRLFSFPPQVIQL